MGKCYSLQIGPTAASIICRGDKMVMPDTCHGITTFKLDDIPTLHAIQVSQYIATKAITTCASIFGYVYIGGMGTVQPKAYTTRCYCRQSNH